MKSIAFVSTMLSASWGGSEILWSEAAELLLAQGIKVYINVKAWNPIAPKIQSLSLKGASVTHRIFYTHPSLLQKLSDIVRDKNKRFNPYYNPVQYLLDTKPELLVICQGNNQDGVEWMEAAQNTGTPYVNISQAASESSWPEDSLSLRLLHGFTLAKHNFFVSNANKQLTELQIGGLLNNATTVRNPFNVPYHNQIPYPSDTTQYRLACVGRIQPDAKGHDLLVSLMRLPKWKTRPISITFYGKGPNESSLKRLIQTFDISNIHFGGHVNHVNQIWEQHHALILPSRYEGLPLAVVEAMLCGRPCIVTDIAGNREVITDNDTGFLAAAPNIDLLDEALERAWQQRTNWETIGKRAQEAIKEKVSECPAKDLALLLTNIIA